jgi:hypothetical protein
MPEDRKAIDKQAMLQLLAEMGPVSAELRDLYGKTIKTAPSGDRHTEVVGSPGLARDVEELLTTVPMLRGLVKKVTSLPNEDVFAYRNEMGFGQQPNPNDKQFPVYPPSLLGQFGHTSREISINPSLTRAAEGDPDRTHEPNQRAATLAHEFGHAAGVRHGRHLDNIAGVARMLEEYKRRNQNK